MAEDCEPPALSPEEENRIVAFHEGAHAVMYWNLGIGVQRVWVDRQRHCGHVQGLRVGKGRSSRVSSAVACLAGLAAQYYLHPETRTREVVRSYTDFRYALVDFLPPGELTDGEQLGVALALTSEVAVLLKEPEIRKQIHALVPPLI